MDLLTVGKEILESAQQAVVSEFGDRAEDFKQIVSARISQILRLFII